MLSMRTVFYILTHWNIVYLNHDQVSLEDDTFNSGWNPQPGAFNEASDEEVFGLEDLPSSDEDDDGSGFSDPDAAALDPSDDELLDRSESAATDEEPEYSTWGKSKKTYYSGETYCLSGMEYSSSITQLAAIYHSSRTLPALA